MKIYALTEGLKSRTQKCRSPRINNNNNNITKKKSVFAFIRYGTRLEAATGSLSFLWRTEATCPFPLSFPSLPLFLFPLPTSFSIKAEWESRLDFSERDIASSRSRRSSRQQLFSRVSAHTSVTRGRFLRIVRNSLIVIESRCRFPGIDFRPRKESRSTRESSSLSFPVISRDSLIYDTMKREFNLIMITWRNAPNFLIHRFPRRDFSVILNSR